MNFKDMLQVAKMSTSQDYDIDISLIDQKENVFVVSDKGFMITSFGNCALFRGTEDMISWCKEKYSKEAPERILDEDLFYQLENKLRENNQKLEGHHLMFLYHHDSKLDSVDGYEYKLYKRDNLEEIYKHKGYCMALSYKKDIDVMAIAAFKDGELASIAACDDRNKEMWQIGIDTVEKYRGKGLASYLVYKLAHEILKQNKAINYTTWGANIQSINVALKAGFRPVSTFYYAKEIKK